MQRFVGPSQGPQVIDLKGRAACPLKFFHQLAHRRWGVVGSTRSHHCGEQQQPPGGPQHPHRPFQLGHPERLVLGSRKAHRDCVNRLCGQLRRPPRLEGRDPPRQGAVERPRMRGVFGQHPSLNAVDLQAAKCVDESDPERFGHLPPHRLLRASPWSPADPEGGPHAYSKLPLSWIPSRAVDSCGTARTSNKGSGLLARASSGSSSQLGPEKLRSPPTRNSRYWC